MGKFESSEVEREAVRTVAAMMAVSARTAPKARGIDDTKTMVIDGDDLELIAGAMDDQAKEQPAHLAAIFTRDAGNVRKSSAILLVGVTGHPKVAAKPIDCGACGYGTCKQLLEARTKQGKDFSGPVCMLQSLDLGIALGSAVKTASEFNIDNRMMYTIGAAAKKLELLDSDVIIGIPLSASGKSIYFDRK
jgi:uncharacterized ferredoxin-like protein